MDLRGDAHDCLLPMLFFVLMHRGLQNQLATGISVELKWRLSTALIPVAQIATTSYEKILLHLLERDYISLGFWKCTLHVSKEFEYDSVYHIVFKEFKYDHSVIIQEQMTILFFVSVEFIENHYQ